MSTKNTIDTKSHCEDKTVMATEPDCGTKTYVNTNTNTGKETKSSSNSTPNNSTEGNSNGPTPNVQKFGNDQLYESPFDVYIFSPIGEKLVDPCYSVGLSPNKVTTVSKIFETLAIVFALTLNYKLAGTMYFIGYIFDCVDGRLARKYKMCSNFGMMYDFNSDMITHFVLFFVLVAQNGFYFFHIFILLTMGYLGNIYYGLVQAINTMKKIQDDNFYGQLKKQLSDEKPKWFVKMFLMFHWSSYDCYRSLVHNYNPVRAHQYMRVLKYFGPGTFAMLMTLILFLNLGAYCKYTLPQVLFFVNSMNTSFVVLLSVVAAVIMYLHSGRKKKYIALNFVHYGGILLGFVITTAAENNLTLSSGIGLLIFHICYDIDCRMFRQIYDQ